MEITRKNMDHGKNRKINNQKAKTYDHYHHYCRRHHHHHHHDYYRCCPDMPLSNYASIKLCHSQTVAPSNCRVIAYGLFDGIS